MISSNKQIALNTEYYYSRHDSGFSMSGQASQSSLEAYRALILSRRVYDPQAFVIDGAILRE